MLSVFVISLPLKKNTHIFSTEHFSIRSADCFCVYIFVFHFRLSIEWQIQIYLAKQSKQLNVLLC